MMRMIRPLTLWVLLAATLLAWQSVAARELPDFTELVEEAAPGVVNISTSRTVPGRSDPFQGFGGQELPEIFRHFFGDRFPAPPGGDRKSTRLNSSHVRISYAVFCLKKKKKNGRQV